MNITFAIESFIDYCDSMMIVNESATGINKKYERFQKEMEKIKEEIKKEKDIDKIISLLNKEKSLIQQTKSAIMSENELGFRDSLKILKSTLGPLFVGAITVAAAKSKKVDKGTVLAGGGLTLFAGLMTKFDIEELKETKQKVIKALDQTTLNINSLISQFKYVKKQGAKSTDELEINYDRNSVTKNRSTLMSIWDKMFDKVKPVDELETDSLSKSERKPYADQMQKETVAFLKTWANNSEFKKVYQKYLHMINIHPTDYGDLFSVTITDYQSGIDNDSDDMNTDWYDDLLEAGEFFIKKRFEAWGGIVWSDIDFGDGDEGTIYVN